MGRRRVYIGFFELPVLIVLLALWLLGVALLGSGAWMLYLLWAMQG
ncbi:MAG TPA: hypothetical protein VE568_00975 [Rubrobacter sp.]|nr:hypothetical protein [Rubrobacter sp.]